MWNIKLYFAFFEQTAQNKHNDKVTFVCLVLLYFHLGKTADQVHWIILMEGLQWMCQENMALLSVSVKYRVAHEMSYHWLCM